MPNLKVRCPLKEYASTIYTWNIFNKFQDELLESFKLKKEKLDRNGSSIQYKVSNFHNPDEIFLVTLDVEFLDVSC
jgi:SWIM zinc finger